MRRLRIVALVSLVYDTAIGVALLVGADFLARTFGVPAPEPRIFVETSGLFLVVIGVGYALPWARPERYRAYMWLMGPILKGLGALTFALDHFAHGTPASFLLFSATDGSLALVTLWALVSTRHLVAAYDVASTRTAGSREP